MRLTKVLLTILVIFGINLPSFAQSDDNLIVTPEQPVQGENIQIKYRPVEGLKTSKQVNGVIYLYNNYRWTADDLQLKRENGVWISTYLLPKDCGFFALKFEGDSLSDVGSGGSYARFVYEADGQKAQGAYVGWGLIRSPGYGHLIPGYTTESISDTATYFWINQEITYHQKEAAPLFAYEYCLALKKSKMSDAEIKIGRCLKYLQNNPTEKNLLSEEAIYRNVLEQNQKADSVHQINMEKYPSGALSRLAAYREAVNERDMATRNKLMRKFLVEFPKKPADERFNDDNVISYDNIYFSLLFSEVFKKNYNALYEYLPKLSLGGLVNVYYKIITIPHNRKDLSDDFLYPYADSLVKQILKEKNDKPFQYRFLSPKEWNRKFEKMLTQEVLLTHVSLLRNSGHISEALSYAGRAQKVLNYTVAGLNEDLCYLLEQEGKQRELDSVLRKSMYHNQVTPYLIDLLKKNYVAKKGSAAGFDAYMRSLKKTESAGEISERILKDKRQGKMPAWELVDANGKKISSKDLLGKTYVLDFWASWCVPCKASFPGMKLAVERYRNKSDVALFFVNTEEYLPTYKEAAKKFITEKNYPFHILFDNKVAGAKVNDELFSKVCKEFKISGIPQKVFVDKKGNVQFISVGYKGSPSELADDISELIEATKKAAAK